MSNDVTALREKTKESVVVAAFDEEEKTRNEGQIDLLKTLFSTTLSTHTFVAHVLQRTSYFED